MLEVVVSGVYFAGMLESDQDAITACGMPILATYAVILGNK